MAGKIKIDFMRAQQWENDVDSELEEVNVLLKQVAEVWQNPMDEDPILKAMDETSTKLHESWDILCSKFTEWSGILRMAIAKLAEAAKRCEEIARSAGN